MALNRKKLQQKKAKKDAKNKLRKIQQKKGSIMMRITSKMAIKQALQEPIFECWEPEQLFEEGIGTVIVSRKTKQNDILMSAFLLDVYCLGIKNCYTQLIDEEEYKFRLESINKDEQLKLIHPSCARKLVEETEKYAEELGFSPHKDYQATKMIFGEIDKICPRSFEFGKDGKPFYIAGPNDNQAFTEKVINTLIKKLGHEGFHYLGMLDGPDSNFD